MCQVKDILFFSIDRHGGFDGASGIRGRDFEARFTSKHLAQGVKTQDAHYIYVKAAANADERFCAASPSVHALFKQMAPALETSSAGAICLSKTCTD